MAGTPSFLCAVIRPLATRCSRLRLRRFAAAATDLGYLLVAAFPTLQVPARWWARRRYRRLSHRYDAIAAADADYLTPLWALLDALRVSPALAVDVGAGTGVAVRLLRARHHDVPVIAIDLVPEMLRRLRARGDPQVRAVVGDAFHLPLRSNTADLVLTSNAPFSLLELVRVLRPGGSAAVVLSGAQGIPARMRAWCLRRACRADIICERAYGGGIGMAWVFRYRGS